jgi:hypothetical protein
MYIDIFHNPDYRIEAMGETEAPCSRLGLYNLLTEDNPAFTDIDRMITPSRYAAY